MFRTMLLVAMLLCAPAWAQPSRAQPSRAPDCTVDGSLTQGDGLKLDIVYRCRSADALTFQADGDVSVSKVLSFRDGSGASQPIAPGGWRVEPVNGLVEARYRYDLTGYARAVDSPSKAQQRGEGVISLLSGWLLEPFGYTQLPTIDIRMTTAPGLVFASGLPRVGDAWRLAGTTTRFAGYTVLGRLDLQELAVPLPGSLRPGEVPGETKGQGVLRLALLDGFTSGQRGELLDWVRRTAEAESNYWQGFTARQMLLVLVPVPQRRGIGYGRTVPGGGPTVMVEVGADMDQRRVFDDWVLVHELIHTGMAFIRGRGTWFMEGAATYVEPIIRARAGWKTEEEVWREWVTNMPQGTPAFARGLGDASGRENYWGGALFMLLADVEIRRATDGAKGLEDCLGGVLWSGLDGSQRATLDAYAAVCDRATGTPALRHLIDRYVVSARPVDLGTVWRDLGVAMVGGRIAFDDSAPDARWRKMIVMGPPGQPPKRVPLPWGP
ncbi:MAG: hypothetical protein EXR12_08970 [Rhodospirillaceae bacterium]|nr:hypothetical protein [Rhodospirillaceae bacterium]